MVLNVKRRVVFTIQLTSKHQPGFAGQVYRNPTQQENPICFSSRKNISPDCCIFPPTTSTQVPFEKGTLNVHWSSRIFQSNTEEKLMLNLPKSAERTPSRQGVRDEYKFCFSEKHSSLQSCLVNVGNASFEKLLGDEPPSALIEHVVVVPYLVVKFNFKTNVSLFLSFSDCILFASYFTRKFPFCDQNNFFAPTLGESKREKMPTSSLENPGICIL